MNRFIVAILAFLGGCAYLILALSNRSAAANLMPVVAALVLVVFGLNALARGHQHRHPAHRPARARTTNGAPPRARR